MPNGTIILVRTTSSTATAQEFRLIFPLTKRLFLSSSIIEAVKLYKRTQDVTWGSFFSAMHYRYLRGKSEKQILNMLGSSPSLLIRQASTLSKTPSLQGSVRVNLLSPSEQKKDQEDQGGDEERRLPLRKPLHRNILDFSGSSEAASVDRNKSEATDQVLDGFFGGMDISGVVNLTQESFNFWVVLKRSSIL